MFPAIEGLPKGINLFALHAADGTPLALTDSHQAAVGPRHGRRAGDRQPALIQGRLPRN